MAAVEVGEYAVPAQGDPPTRRVVVGAAEMISRWDSALRGLCHDLGLLR